MTALTDALPRLAYLFTQICGYRFGSHIAKRRAEEIANMKTRIAVVGLMSLVFALPIFGETYKSMYPMPCSELWPAVKDALSNPDNYDVVGSDEAKMTASYKVKHTAHVTITGAVLQRTNKVTLVPKDTGCQMQVVSNYSGFEHNDRDDFKKRVDESLANPKTAKPAEAAKPGGPTP